MQQAQYVYYIPYTAVRPAQEAIVSGDGGSGEVMSPAVPAYRVFSALSIALDGPMTPASLVEIAAMIQQQEGVVDATPTGFHLLSSPEAGAQLLEALKEDQRALLIEAYMAGLAASGSEFAGPGSAGVWADKKLAALALPEQADASKDQEALALA